MYDRSLLFAVKCSQSSWLIREINFVLLAESFECSLLCEIDPCPREGQHAEVLRVVPDLSDILVLFSFLTPVEVVQPRNQAVERINIVELLEVVHSIFNSLCFILQFVACVIDLLHQLGQLGRAKFD